MPTILDKILARKREEVAALLAGTSREALRERALAMPAGPGFVAALDAPGGMRLIAEVKKASPSKGVIRADFDPVAIARAYERGGAAALSVLTDRDFFQGDLAYLGAIRGAVALPLLRKDFVIDDAQVHEARAAGASAVLLIAAALKADELGALHATADAVGLDVLVEVHDEADVARVEASGCRLRLVGINNRNLHTFETDLAVTERLGPELARRALLVSESGIFTPADVARVAAAGARAVLVGESLMRQPDPAVAARQLMAGTP
ncbi:MAG: indole-3-glycerol phosphate synthase TrpC [Candidatus Sumerlaeia bacterium]|nr:indole-3-glycerol phosphate synthase TrpC [Candidatus Sumerlaeia bacterium]